MRGGVGDGKGIGKYSERLPMVFLASMPPAIPAPVPPAQHKAPGDFSCHALLIRHRNSVHIAHALIGCRIDTLALQPIHDALRAAGTGGLFQSQDIIRLPLAGIRQHHLITGTQAFAHFHPVA